MQDILNIRQLLRQQGEALKGEAQFDFSARDFLGFSVPVPVEFSWQAKPSGDAVRLDMHIEATVSAECVRCLESFTGPEVLDKTYDIRLADLEGEYPEYPATLDGNLDLEEMAYGELVLEVSPVQVCREDCPGLCSQCGQPAQNCACNKKPPMDPRWQALADLWESGEDEAEEAEK